MATPQPVNLNGVDVPMRSRGMFLRDIGSEFGISGTQVLRILRGQRKEAA